MTTKSDFEEVLKQYDLVDTNRSTLYYNMQGLIKEKVFTQAQAPNCFLYQKYEDHYSLADEIVYSPAFNYIMYVGARGYNITDFGLKCFKKQLEKLHTDLVNALKDQKMYRINLKLKEIGGDFAIGH